MLAYKIWHQIHSCILKRLHLNNMSGVWEGKIDLFKKLKSNYILGDRYSQFLKPINQRKYLYIFSYLCGIKNFKFLKKVHNFLKNCIFSRIECFQPTNDTLLDLHVCQNVSSSKKIKLLSFGKAKHHVHYI